MFVISPGLEGKRQDYTPYSCMKIIGFNVGSGEHHGCPYKSFSTQQLRAALGRWVGAWHWATSTAVIVHCCCLCKHNVMGWPR